MKLPSVFNLHPLSGNVAERSATRETMFNDATAVNDERLREADTVLKHYV
jgi:hypothetical protein